MPAILSYLLTAMPNNRLIGSTRMVMFKYPQGGNQPGTSSLGATVTLNASIRRYDRISAPAAVLDTHVTPYAWRILFQQAEVQIGNTLKWGPELEYENRVLMANVATGSGSTHITVVNTSYPTTPTFLIRPHHIVLIGQNGNYHEAYVLSVDSPTQFTIQQPVPNFTVHANDEVRDEWSPDYVIANPVNVQVENANATNAQVATSSLTEPRTSMGDNQLPNSTSSLSANPTSSSPGILAIKANAAANWLSTPTQPTNHFTMSLLDLKLAGAIQSPMLPGWQANAVYVTGQFVQSPLPNGYMYLCSSTGTSGTNPPVWPTSAGATCTDGTVTWTALRAGWNSMLDAALSSETQFGVPSPSGDWNDLIDTRYDPYLENHLRLMPEAVEQPGGSALASQQIAPERMSQDIPLNQVNSAAPGAQPADSSSYLDQVVRTVPQIFKDANNHTYMSMDYRLYIAGLIIPTNAQWDNTVGWYINSTATPVYARQDTASGWWFVDWAQTGAYVQGVDSLFPYIQVNTGNGISQRAIPGSERQWRV